MINSEKKTSYFHYIYIGLVSLVLILPQWLGKEVILGADSLFHYNRFYDAAVQIKEGNISYFISIYGFQQSARIVNALYGPLFAYVQGLLVLMSKNWFTYQLLSRFLVQYLAAFSMYRLLARLQLDLTYRLLLSLLYMTTFSIQYWTIRQGFSSWGAALMPYCLIPAVSFMQDRKINPIRLGGSVALMLQVHILSSLFLVLMYLPFYLYGFILAPKKWQIIWQGVKAVGLSILLTLNLWLALWFLRKDNILLDPFINRTMGENSIDGTAAYWLDRPVMLLLIFLFHIIYISVKWYDLSPREWVVNGTYGAFFMMSTSFFPWQRMVDNNVKIAELIQFPFRLFIPATVLLIFVFATILTKFTRSSNLLTALLLFLVSVSIGQVTKEALNKEVKAREHHYVLAPGKHAYTMASYEKQRQDVFSTDKSLLLSDLQKATPDYVPLYHSIEGKNTYILYAQHIIQSEKSVKKTVNNGKLTLTWSSLREELIELPVFYYKRTQLMLNGHLVTPVKSALSEIGNPSLKSQKGTNVLVVTYQEPIWFTVVLCITLFSWGSFMMFSIYHWWQQNR